MGSEPVLRAETIEAWIAWHGLEALLDAPVDGLARVAGGYFRYDFRRRVPLRHVLDRYWERRAAPLMLEAWQDAQAQLSDRLARARTARLPPELAAARELLLPLTRPLVLDAARVTVEDYGTLVVRMGRESARLDLRDLRLTTSSDDLDLGTAANLLLLALVGKVGKTARAFLAKPRWAHRLAELDREDTDVAVDPIGWRVSTHGAVVTKVRAVDVSTDARGRPKTRLAKHVGRERLTHPADGVAEHADPIEALHALVGHPRVFVDGRHTPVPVVRGTCSVRLQEDGGAVVSHVLLDGEPITAAQRECFGALREDDGQVVVVGSDRVRVIRIAPASLPLIAAVLDGAFPEVPVTHAAEVLERVPRWASTTPLVVGPGLAGVELDADLRPRVRLERTERGLRLVVHVQPLPDGEEFLPGEGAVQLFALVGGERATVRRDLEAEPVHIAAALADLRLDEARSVGPFCWDLEPPRAVDVLQVLQAHPERFKVSWDGKPVRVRQVASAAALSLKVRTAEHWLTVDGGLRVGRKVVPVDQVLEAIRTGEPYLALSTADWVTLSGGLREQLAAVAEVAQRDGTLGTLAAGVLAQLEADGATIGGDAGWTLQRTRMTEAAALVGEAPATLQATLRPYQVDGVRWLIRLAHWAPGAVLADDMGLGKTVQALALALHRADGPTLVVAPTSVGFNWVAEAARFAPSLVARLYRGPDRTLDGVGPGHLVVTSWALLVRDREALEDVAWTTVILDEAQAVKNPATRRAKAARALSGGFTLALTGTPVENRALDLWSILRIATPGLLPGRERFSERLGGPATAGDATARAALARIVRPFVLRRTKRLVARDLPERTEVVIPITLSAGERLLYDQANLAALAQLRGGAGAFAVLPALTRLRQAACHPRLVDPGSTAPSSKSTWLRRKLIDLAEGGHRALVFSQFVQHLKLVQAALEGSGLTLRYLDGGTPAERRQAEVEAFQAGEGDVFLISLKAGGTGLNLTAADYVFHVDPWWNPAVEDQATDRAHRIGQTRPVAVYRLVAEDTIEERIVELHAEKRELADGLLSGTGTAKTLTPEELIALLTGAEQGTDADTGAVAPATPQGQGGGPDPSTVHRPPSTPPPTTPASGAARPPDPSTVHRPPSTPPLDLDAWLARYDAHLEAELASGALGRRATARNYRRSVERFVTWVRPRSPATPAAVEAAAAEWLAAVKRRETGTGTDKVFGGPGLRRALPLLSPS